MKNLNPLIYIVLSAFLFGSSIPFAKLLVGNIPPTALAGLLYLGAFAGLSLYSFLREKLTTTSDEKEAPLESKDYSWLIGAVITGGIIAPICLMMGLQLVSGFSAALLLNLEGLFTALIAVFFFKESAGKQFWLALVCMTLAGALLTWDPKQNNFNIIGPFLVVLAMINWGIDNNLTRNISDKDPIQTAKIKGLIAGTTSLLLALILGLKPSLDMTIILALLLGALSYGTSLVLFIKALKGLGASRTGAFFSFGPFIGAILSLIILRESIGWGLVPATVLMIIGVWLINQEKHSHRHFHAELNLSHEHPHWPDQSHRHEHK